MAGTAGAATYYVDSTSGSDARSGTSAAQAWKTLAKASQAPLAPGDRLLLDRGGVWSGKLAISPSGTASTPIVISAYGTGNLPLIHGDCISLQGSYLVLGEVQADGCSWSGVDVWGDYDRVKQSVFTHNIAGVFVRPGAFGATVLKNRIADNNRMSVLTPSPSNDDSGAFGVLLQGDGAVVARNTISGGDSFSYDYGRDGSAIEVVGGQQNQIRYNVALENESFTELGNPRAADNTYAYNVVHSSLANSEFLVTRGAGSGLGPVARTSLYDNSVLLTGSSSQGFICYAGCGPGILRMRDNLVQAVQKAGYADAPFDEDYDVFFGGIVQFAKGAHSLVADPRFADPVAGDLPLRSSSPAVDRGVGVGYSLDLDRQPVPQDGDGDGVAAPDAGAYELSPSAP
jgi:hypothetical protein